MKYVVQDLGDDDIWDERPERFYSLGAALAEIDRDDAAQVVAIPSGEIVWRSAFIELLGID